MLHAHFRLLQSDVDRAAGRVERPTTVTDITPENCWEARENYMALSKEVLKRICELRGLSCGGQLKSVFDRRLTRDDALRQNGRQPTATEVYQRNHDEAMLAEEDPWYPQNYLRMNRNELVRLIQGRGIEVNIRGKSAQELVIILTTSDADRLANDNTVDADVYDLREQINVYDAHHVQTDQPDAYLPSEQELAEANLATAMIEGLAFDEEDIVNENERENEDFS